MPDVDKFTRLEGFNGSLVPETWTEYTATLPEGTRQFAIRNNSVGSFILFVDDVTFSRYYDFSDLNVKGYNVYCGDEKLNSEPVATPAFVHSDAADGESTYRVSVVYKEGESELSAPVTVKRSGVENVAYEAASAGVYAHDSAIIVEGAPRGTGVTVTTLDGRVVAVGDGSCRLEVAPGIYLVKVGDDVAKLLVP